MSDQLGYWEETDICWKYRSSRFDDTVATVFEHPIKGGGVVYTATMLRKKKKKKEFDTLDEAKQWVTDERKNQSARTQLISRELLSHMIAFMEKHRVYIAGELSGRDFDSDMTYAIRLDIGGSSQSAGVDKAEVRSHDLMWLKNAAYKMGISPEAYARTLYLSVARNPEPPTGPTPLPPQDYCEP